MVKSDEQLKLKLREFEDQSKALAESYANLKDTYAKLKPEEQISINLELAKSNTDSMQVQNDGYIKFLKEYLKVRKENANEGAKLLRNKESALKAELNFLEYIKQ